MKNQSNTKAMQAAAPDMLAALKSARATIASMGGDLEVTAPESINANSYRDEIRRINAAIAKAEGRDVRNVVEKTVTQIDPKTGEMIETEAAFVMVKVLK